MGKNEENYFAGSRVKAGVWGFGNVRLIMEKEAFTTRFVLQAPSVIVCPCLNSSNANCLWSVYYKESRGSTDQSVKVL